MMARTAGALLLVVGCVPMEGHHTYEREQGGHSAARNHFVEEGLASWYGMSSKGRVYEHGKATASGRPYDQNAMTAAHKTLPLGTRVKVTRTDTGRSIVVVINDRGPYIEGRIIDLTLRGARILGYEHEGTASVRIEALP